MGLGWRDRAPRWGAGGRTRGRTIELQPQVRVLPWVEEPLAFLLTVLQDPFQGKAHKHSPCCLTVTVLCHLGFLAEHGLFWVTKVLVELRPDFYILQRFPAPRGRPGTWGLLELPILPVEHRGSHNRGHHLQMSLQGRGGRKQSHGGATPPVPAVQCPWAGAEAPLGASELAVVVVAEDTWRSPLASALLLTWWNRG